MIAEWSTPDRPTQATTTSHVRFMGWNPMPLLFLEVGAQVFAEIGAGAEEEAFYGG